MGNLLKGIVVFVLFLFISISLSAQRIDTAWTKTFGGSNFDYGRSVKQTTDGGYIIAGATGSSGAGSLDVYLIKTDSLGDTLWTKTFGGSNNDNGYSVRQTDDGGYIVAGSTESYGVGSWDVYLIKTDSLGDTLWTKTFGGDNTDEGRSVQQTTDGGYIVGGYTYSYGAGEIYLIKTDSIGDTLWTKTYRIMEIDECFSVQQTSDGGYIVAGGTYRYVPGYDAYLLKTDSLGDTLWTKIFGGDNTDEGRSVQQTTDGGYIVGGYTYSYGTGESDVYLIKTDSLGDTLWTKTFGGSERDIGSPVQQTTDAGYIIAGYTNSFGTGGYDVYLIKTDSLGDTLWTKTFGGSDEDGGLSVQETTDGGYIVGGYTYSYGTGESDVFLLKIKLFPGINITSPNGEEEWQADSIHDITWRSYETSGGVKLEYSLNNGLDWAEIIASTTDDGSYSWTIPDTMSYNCLVRISDTNGTVSDISDAVFTIYSNPFIVVTSPNGGEIWKVDSTYDITWVSAGTSGAVKIEYSLNNGSDWITIADTTADVEIYSWTIPSYTSSDSCLVSVTDVDGSPSDTSDALFRIVSFITVFSPNGGEKWYNEDNHYITWISAGTSGEVKIEYSINNGRDWAEIITSTPDSGSYLWNPPDTVSDSCLVSISDTNGSISDTSDLVFSIIPGSGVPIGSFEIYSLTVRAIATGSQVEFTYTLPEKANDVRFVLYNVAGLKIKEENLKESPAGFYSGKINLSGVSKGIYFIRMEANGGKFTQTRKFVLM